MSSDTEAPQFRYTRLEVLFGQLDNWLYPRRDRGKRDPTKAPVTKDLADYIEQWVEGLAPDDATRLIADLQMGTWAELGDYAFMRISHELKAAYFKARPVTKRELEWNTGALRGGGASFPSVTVLEGILAVS